MIDNYDSFTWNLYEYLCQEGAEVLVYRNDKITIPEIEALHPTVSSFRLALATRSMTRASRASVSSISPARSPWLAFAWASSAFSLSLVVKFPTPGRLFTARLPPSPTMVRAFLMVFRRIFLWQDTTPLRAHSPRSQTLWRSHREQIMASFWVSVTKYHHRGCSVPSREYSLTRKAISWSATFWKSPAAPGKSRRPLQKSDAIASSATASESILDKIFAQRKQDIEAQKLVPGQSFADLEKTFWTWVLHLS